MKKKGLIFIVIISTLFWGYYFFKKKPVDKSRTRYSVEDAYKAVHAANLKVIKASILIFSKKEGRYPFDLHELIEKGYLETIPDPGFKEWEYNPKDGSIS